MDQNSRQKNGKLVANFLKNKLAKNSQKSKNHENKEKQ